MRRRRRRRRRRRAIIDVERKNKKKKYNQSVSSIVGGIVIIVVAIAIIRCVQKTRMQSRNTSVQTTVRSAATTQLDSAVNADTKVDMATIERFLDDILKERPVRFTPQNLIDFTQNYTKKLCSGGFGVVYQGQFPNGVQIAVKVLHKTQDKRAEEQFMAEVGTIGRTYRINLVQLYGLCFDDTLKALVYE
ncbi:hypothetical protein J5N97_026779 [Dioscorea zingiberensis]|uniref:Protein kinase domain-containing protein n=1 Tax=Dioscorea zingiberensis TaxID=325984 RepID=A0A9D5H6Z5_9LILI|nr:hypothetical protein J5N97_026779 [Dioscorea zingiberensis]